MSIVPKMSEVWIRVAQQRRSLFYHWNMAQIINRCFSHWYSGLLSPTHGPLVLSSRWCLSLHQYSNSIQTLASGVFFPGSSCRLSSTLVCRWGRVYARTLVPVIATCRVTIPWLRSYCGRNFLSSRHEANRKVLPAQTNSENSNQKGPNVRPAPLLRCPSGLPALWRVWP